MRLRAYTVAVSLLAAEVALGGGPATETDRWIEWSERRVETLLRRGIYEDAVEELLVIATMRTHDVSVLSRAAVVAVDAEVLRGRELTQKGPFYRMAEWCVREGVARGGAQDPGLAYAIGRLRYSDQDWGTAWRMLRQARELGFDPVRTGHWYYRTVVNRSAALVDAGRYDEALAQLRTVLAEYPGHPDETAARVNLAAAHSGNSVQEPGVAKEILLDVLRTEPGNAKALYLLGIILAGEGLGDEAIVRFREAMASASATPQDRTYGQCLLREADVHLKMGRFDEAEDCAKRYLALRKDDTDGIFALGRVEQARGRTKEALRLFRRCARLRPESYETLMRLSQVLYQIGEDAEAAELRRRMDEIQRRWEEKLLGRDETMR